MTAWSFLWQKMTELSCLETDMHMRRDLDYKYLT